MGNHETLSEFISKMLYSVFPIIWVLLLIACFRLRYFKKEIKVVYLFGLVLVTGVVIRSMQWSITHRYSGRYTAIIVVILTILSVPGITHLANILYINLKKRYPTIKSKYVITGILGIITLACLGKSLRPDRSRPWQEGIYPFVQSALTDKSQPIIMITTKKDRRASYYSHAKGFVYDMKRHVLIKNIKGAALLFKNIYKLKTPNIFILLHIDYTDMPEEFKAIPKTKIKVFYSKRKKHKFTLYRLDIKQTK